jgi:hypothetical protein
MKETRTCRICGAPFKAARTGVTVHCPKHRGRTPKAITYEALGCTPRPPICRCGKTVLTPGITCPRKCEETR